MLVYPVQLEVSPPARYDRMQLIVRLAIAIALAWLGITAGWLSWLLFLALPVIAACVVSMCGGDYYLTKTGTSVWSALRWLFEFSGYMLLVSDRIPIDGARSLDVELRTTGHPSLGRALGRLVTSIPSAIALCFLGFVSCVFWVIAMSSILFTGAIPGSITAFQIGYLRWQARLAAYHASLVEEYPPFSFGDRTAKLPTAMVQP